MPRFTLWILLCSATLPCLAGAEEPQYDAAYRAAVEKAIPLISKSVMEYPKHRECFSCHHQAVPMLAVGIARDRGFSVDPEVLNQIVEQTRDDLEGAIDSYRKGQGQGGGATRAGYALLTLKSGGVKPDELTAAVAGFLLGRDEDRPQWRTTSDRPPSEASDFTTTYLAIVALRAYRVGGDERVEARVGKAREWLESTEGKSTEDQVFRLLGLHASNANPDAIATAVSRLKAAQKEDGGWSQLGDMPPDAYATGSVLVALNQAGGLSPTDPVYKAGLKFLLESQLGDGSWHVISRSKPFQPYFESGFPHEKDQFISMAATSWATAALAIGCQERSIPAAPAEKLEAPEPR